MQVKLGQEIIPASMLYSVGILIKRYFKWEFCARFV